MKNKEISLLLIGAGIGTYIGGVFTGPFAIINPFIGLILIVAGIVLWLRK